MTETLMVVIQYKGHKYKQLVSGMLSEKTAIQILFKDLLALRANRPSENNIRRADGKFYLTWKSAGGQKDRNSLYTTWNRVAGMKEAIDDLSIESITVHKSSLDPGTPTNLANPTHRPSLPSRPMVPVIAQIPSLHMKPPATPMNEVIKTLNDELWNVRKQIVQLKARETDLITALRRTDDAPGHMLEDDKVQVQELEKRLGRLENELKWERCERLRAERCLNEVEKECRDPFVVPALLRAFLNISEMHI